MVKDKELKGEHFHGNNPDMKLYFAKPDKAEIDEMNYKKPITSYKDVKKYKNNLNLCDLCHMIILDIAERRN